MVRSSPNLVLPNVVWYWTKSDQIILEKIFGTRPVEDYMKLISSRTRSDQIKGEKLAWTKSDQTKLDWTRLDYMKI